jgi:hypothetical protein
MSPSLFSSFQENTKCESGFFADTCTPRVPIFAYILNKKDVNGGGQVGWIILQDYQAVWNAHINQNNFEQLCKYIY